LSKPCRVFLYNIIDTAVKTNTQIRLSYVYTRGHFNSNDTVSNIFICIYIYPKNIRRPLNNKLVDIYWRQFKRNNIKLYVFKCSLGIWHNLLHNNQNSYVYSARINMYFDVFFLYILNALTYVFSHALNTTKMLHQRSGFSSFWAYYFVHRRLFFKRWDGHARQYAEEDKIVWDWDRMKSVNSPEVFCREVFVKKGKAGSAESNNLTETTI